RGFRRCFRRGARELRAKKIEEGAGARPAVPLVPSDAQQENQQIKNLHILQAAGACLFRFLLARLLQELGEPPIEGAGERVVRRPLIQNAGAESAMSFRERRQGGSGLRVIKQAILGGKLQNREAQAREK